MGLSPNGVSVSLHQTLIQGSAALARADGADGFVVGVPTGWILGTSAARSTGSRWRPQVLHACRRDTNRTASNRSSTSMHAPASLIFYTRRTLPIRSCPSSGPPMRLSSSRGSILVVGLAPGLTRLAPWSSRAGQLGMPTWRESAFAMHGMDLVIDGGSRSMGEIRRRAHRHSCNGPAGRDPLVLRPARCPRAAGLG